MTTMVSSADRWAMACAAAWEIAVSAKIGDVIEYESLEELGDAGRDELRRQLKACGLMLFDEGGAYRVVV